MDPRAFFVFKEWVLESVESGLINFDVSCSYGIHVRLGDYRGLPLFCVPGTAYYRAASQKMRGLGTGPPLVFSDVPDAINPIELGLGEDAMVVKGASDVVDLYLMTKCKAMVIAPSAFSWWGAYLGGGVVICPAGGMTRPGSPVRHIEAYPAEWEQLSAGLLPWQAWRQTIIARALVTFIISKYQRAFRFLLRIVAQLRINLIR